MCIVTQKFQGYILLTCLSIQDDVVISINQCYIIFLYIILIVVNSLFTTDYILVNFYDILYHVLY